MRIFKVVLSSGDPILVSEDELPGVINAIKENKIVFTKMGIFNPSFFVEIVPHDIHPDESTWYQRKFEETSVFAKVLSKKLPQLTDAGRTKIQEEVAREERRIKSGF